MHDLYRVFTERLVLAEVLKLITESFFLESSHPTNPTRLLIINSDETNYLFDLGNEGKLFLKKLFCILRTASKALTLLTIHSSTYLVVLFEVVQVSGCQFVDVELTLIELDLAKKVLLELVPIPHYHYNSPRLETF